MPSPNDRSRIALAADPDDPEDFPISERGVEAALAARRARHAADAVPVTFDDDNPEWTDADVARARPIADFPALATAFPHAGGSRADGAKARSRDAD